MKTTIKKLLKHPLIYGSTIIVLGNLVANFFNFLYNLFMSRNLSIEDYGTLASLISLLSLPILISNAISPTVVKFAGNYFATYKYGLLRGLYIRIVKLYLYISVPLAILYLLFLPIIGNFFHITDPTILVTTIFIIVIAFMGGVNMAFLQAKLAFGFQVIVGLLNAIVKLIIGFIAVSAGYAVVGATFSILLSGIVSYLVSYAPLKFVFDKKIKMPAIETRSLFSYGITSALTSFGLTLFITMDVILVKHFFDATTTGLYAGLSLIGRVIFYISSPIGTVMFPVIIQKHSRNESLVNTLRLSLFFVLAPSILMTAGYFIFPHFFILFFLKKVEYLSVAPYLGYFGLYICLYGVAFILSMFYLSIKKTNVYIPVVSAALLQTILIIFFHQSILQIVTILISIMTLLVIALAFYYPRATKKK
jgi:O-antigen/teichoic acid export membrane protein